MSCCGKKNCAEMKGEVAENFLDELYQELSGFYNEIRSEDFKPDLVNIFTRLPAFSRRVYSVCLGASMLDSRLEPLANELLVLNRILDEAKKQVLELEPFIARGDLFKGLSADPCLRMLEITAIAAGLSLINPIFVPLAGSIYLLARIICAVIPPE